MTNPSTEVMCPKCLCSTTEGILYQIDMCEACFDAERVAEELALGSADDQVYDEEQGELAYSYWESKQ